MVTVGQAAILMSGKAGDGAFVDIRSIGGLSGDVNRKLSQQVCKLLNDSLGIPPDRVYLNFTDVGAGNSATEPSAEAHGIAEAKGTYVFTTNDAVGDWPAGTAVARVLRLRRQRLWVWRAPCCADWSPLGIDCHAALACHFLLRLPEQPAANVSCVLKPSNCNERIARHR